MKIMLKNRSENADIQHETSVREIITKIFIKLPFFLTCIIMTPLFALLFTYMVPNNYSSQAKILIRYGNSESAFLGGIVNSDRQLVSGKSYVEIAKSLPVCIDVTRSVPIEEADIVRPAFRVLFQYAYNIAKTSLDPFLKMFLKTGSENNSGSRESDLLEVENIAKEFQRTLSVALLDQSTLKANVSDEVIMIKVVSTNKDKVALIANNLCQSFIREYYTLSEIDVYNALDYLNTQQEKIEKQIEYMTTRITIGKEAFDDSLSSLRMATGGYDPQNVNPYLENTIREVSKKEFELARIQFEYPPNSMIVRQMVQELVQARKILEKQEKLAAAKDLLNLIKRKRHDAWMTLQMYQNKLIPISIIESATSPNTSIISSMLRYGIYGALGLLLGILMGLTGVIFFSNFDQKVYTSWDVENNYNLKVLASIPKLSEQTLPRLHNAWKASHGVQPALMQILGRIQPGKNTECQIIMITSVSIGEGKSFMSLNIASALASEKLRVLLIDSDFFNPSLSKLFDALENGGIADVLARDNDKSIHDVVYKKVGGVIDFIGIGNVNNRATIGYFQKSFQDELKKVAKEYDAIIIDGSGILNLSETLLFTAIADHTIVMVRANYTRHKQLQSTLQLMHDAGVRLSGVVLNHRKFYLPKWLYRLV